MKLTGGEVVARSLKEYGVEYVAGVPGHGIWSLFDAFLQEGSQIPFIQVMHEQSAVHWRGNSRLPYGRRSVRASPG